MYAHAAYPVESISLEIPLHQEPGTPHAGRRGGWGGWGGRGEGRGGDVEHICTHMYNYEWNMIILVHMYI